MTLDANDRVYRYRVPLTTPMEWGDRWHTDREGLLLFRAGVEGGGWGEAAPLPGFSRESLSDIIQVLQGGEFSMASCPSSLVCAMEMAELSNNEEVMPSRIPVCALLAGTTETILTRAREAVAEGFTALKLKVGRQKLESDIRLVAQIRRIIGSSIALRLDANRAWTCAEAHTFAAGIEGCGVEFVEEPARNVQDLPQIARCMPVALDESLHGWVPEDLHQHTYVTALVIKPMLIGGIRAAYRWAQEAARLHMPVVISATFETGVGMTALLHVAARVSSTVAHGLDTYRFLQRDVCVPPLNLTAPHVSIPAERSFRLDDDLVERIV